MGVGWTRSSQNISVVWRNNKQRDPTHQSKNGLSRRGGAVLPDAGGPDSAAGAAGRGACGRGDRRVHVPEVSLSGPSADRVGPVRVPSGDDAAVRVPAAALLPGPVKI